MFSLVLIVVASCTWGCDDSSEKRPAPHVDKPGEIVTKPTSTSGGQRPSEKWVFYRCTVEERNAFIRVDVGWGVEVPEARPAWSVRVRLALREPRDDGLTTGPEAAVLHELEDELKRALAPAIFVGVLTNDGHRSWYFYSEDPEPTEDAARAVCAERVPHHEVEVGSFEDPEWSQYREFLYPNDLAWQWIADYNVLASLQAEGDDGTAPRTIRHWAYFPSAADRDSFIAALDGGRYRVDRVTEDREQKSEFCVEFETLEPAPPAEIYPWTEKLFTLARRNRGRYDGWEVQVMKPTKK